MTVAEDFVAAVAAGRAADTPQEYARVRDLAAAGPQALSLAVAHVADPDPVVRSTACRLLGAVAELHDDLRADAATALLDRARVEIEPAVLWSLARALGDTRDARAVPVLVDLAAHGDTDVRYMVATALPWVLGDDPDPAGLAALLALCRDDEVSVRDWATYGLGQVSAADGAAVRAMLWERVADEDEDVRAEAVRGLAHRRDPRAVPLVADLLREPEFNVFNTIAAGLLGDPSLAPLLVAYAPDEDSVADHLRECDPDRRTRRDDFAFDLFDAVAAGRGGVALYGRRCEIGLTLAVGERTWSVEELLDDTGGDCGRAARLVLDEPAT
ncbi:HEAT repeat domain-containing protein [Luedemannella helvata]|uniref:HEAT repeat domain-containing protein n=1 Tax=Luedemannella helvata TaxID=349315 RepID=A0ABN2KB49_9ACTN